MKSPELALATVSTYHEGMKLRMNILPMVALLLFSGAFITSGLAQEKQDSKADIVAEVGGVPITRDDLQSIAADELEAVEIQSLQFQAHLESERHRILEDRLEAMLAEKLVALEASEQGLSTEELLEREIRTKFEEPTQEEVEGFYLINQQTMQGPKVQMLPRIRQHLSDEFEEEAYQAYVDQLSTKYAVASYLEPLRRDIATSGHPSHGPADAPVTIVEFSDFECPYCSGLLGTIRNIQQNYSDQVRLVYRQFPLVNLHPNARKAAEASLCANQQGKFWEMHDLMFEDQTGLSVEALEEKAQSLGLDEAAFQKCLNSAQIAELVQADVRAGAVAGVTGTPALFINGRALVGNVPYAQIAEIIDEELKILQSQE